MHGWLAKMRGTLLGNEALRTKGMQEMRAARHYKKVKRSQPKRKTIDRRDTVPTEQLSSPRGPATSSILAPLEPATVCIPTILSSHTEATA
ncbi:hypothetical protein C8R46DRAFT_1211575 [Mycena filopes]|nr:hypothetical protein C8R46DRAFT_1211575 [Mycena filopes]